MSSASPSTENKNTTETSSIDLVQVVKVLLSKWWILLLSAIVVMVGTLLYTVYQIPRKYTASSAVYVNSTTNLEVQISSSLLQASHNLIETYSTILMTRSTLEEVAVKLEERGVHTDYEALSKMVSAVAVGDTSVMKVEVTSTKRDEAAVIANTIIEVLPERISRIIHGTSVEVVDLAVTPKNPSSPSYSRNALIGFLIGLVLSAGVIFVYEFFIHDIIEDSKWVKENFGEQAPVIATIPDISMIGKRDHYSQYKYYYSESKKPDNANSNHFKFGPGLDMVTQEAYNRLRTNLDFVCPRKEQGGNIIGITSSVPGEGKSFTAVNIAYSLAKNGSKVLLVEGDMRRPAIAKPLSLPSHPGLSNLLIDTTGRAVHNGVLHENMAVLTSGDIPPNPSELIGSPQMKALLDIFSKRFDYVILDLPPINSVIDPVVVSPFLDGMLLVVRHAYTHRKDLTDSIQSIELSNAKLVGFVYNGNYSGNGYYSRKYSSKYYYSKHYRQSKPGETADKASKHKK